MLIVLLAAILAAVGVGAVLLWQRSGQPLATPPQTSTLSPRPATPAARTTAPTARPASPTAPASPTTDPPTTQGSTDEPTTTQPTTTKPTTAKPTTTKPIAEVHDTIEKKLIQEERQKRQKEWIEKLRKKAYIKMF